MNRQTVRARARKLSTRQLVAILSVSTVLAVFAAVQLVGGLQAYARAGAEYEELRREYGPAGGERAEDAGEPEQGPGDRNPDYVGWIQIPDTPVDYPIVQGSDNNRYLTTSFLGSESKLGAIFLDFRCADGLDSPHAIVYGHNAKDGSMFSALSRYLEDGYLEQNPELRITMPDGAERVYRIFSAKDTDITDPAYRLDFEDSAEWEAFTAGLGAPGADHILTLSTCRDGSDLDARLLVHGALA